MRSVLIFLLGLLVGALVGYYCESLLKPYTAQYTFSTTLTLYTTGNTTIYTVGQTILLKASLNVTIPPELSALEDALRKFLLDSKPVTLMFKTQNNTYWSIYDTQQTLYSYMTGEVSFSVSNLEPNVYDFKAVFNGDNALKSSESSVLTITIA